MRRAIILFLGGLFGFNLSFGQTTDRLPWVNGVFPPTKNNTEYRVAFGDATNLNEARKIARNDFLAKITSQAGVEITSEVTVQTANQSEFRNNVATLVETIDFQKTTVIKGKNVNIAFVQVSEYYEYAYGRYQYWELYEISTNSESFKPYIPQYTDRYGMTAAWRSAIVPGWGQFHKGKTGKGVLFLTTEIAFVSGAVFFNMRQSDNMRKSQETTNLTLVREFRDRADKWALYRNVAIGGAAGIYVWNVLDAALAKGKIRYAYIPQNMRLNGTLSDGYYFYGISFNY